VLKHWQLLYVPLTYFVLIELNQQRLKFISKVTVQVWRHFTNVYTSRLMYTLIKQRFVSDGTKSFSSFLLLFAHNGIQWLFSLVVHSTNCSLLFAATNNRSSKPTFISTNWIIYNFCNDLYFILYEKKLLFYFVAISVKESSSKSINFWR
jgi:hypothetical protein